ncbi:4-hydroxy-tetrahydrodipicolinate synthase [Lipingzhangella halophila]|uniref:4-hydroxy-tetrahydrodipicolinate synthase n=1 Tax=Lipingzhangella halophila TaxID=1783352 RepID=A0A7W7W1K7_9ACTN|nr:dihydrodipicolinate synthase family protein [Lipingzhangella halophila]MBB4930418.1 4-hydroxy-tetrahydrodipicolinate synthase [Lipingzhangella halophila]
MSESVAPLPHGLWGVLATPFRNGGAEVDVDSLRAQVRLYLDLGAAGLVALGVFGEGAALDSAEQRSVARAVRAEAGDTPIVVGLSALTTAPAIEQARSILAAEVSPTAFMVQANSADPATLRRHFDAVHEASQTPLVVQDYPVASGVRITPAALLSALREMPYVAAVKSEAPPTAAVIAQLTAETPVSVFGGLGGVGLLDELAAGAAGVMTGFSHPEGLRATLDAWYTHGGDSARAAFQRWLPLVNFEAQPGIGLAIRKEVLHRRGLLQDPAVRPPGPPMPAALRPLLTGHLNALGTQ